MSKVTGDLLKQIGELIKEQVGPGLGTLAATVLGKIEPKNEVERILLDLAKDAAPQSAEAAGALMTQLLGFLEGKNEEAIPAGLTAETLSKLAEQYQALEAAERRRTTEFARTLAAALRRFTALAVSVVTKAL